MLVGIASFCGHAVQDVELSYDPDSVSYRRYADSLQSENGTCRYLPDQFDILMHVDTTSAVEPLFPGKEFRSETDNPDLPETYPFAV